MREECVHLTPARVREHKRDPSLVTNLYVNQHFIKGDLYCT
jgi:hypothetical protein